MILNINPPQSDCSGRIISMYDHTNRSNELLITAVCFLHIMSIRLSAKKDIKHKVHHQQKPILRCKLDSSNPTTTD